MGRVVFSTDFGKQFSEFKSWRIIMPQKMVFGENDGGEKEKKRSFFRETWSSLVIITSRKNTIGESFNTLSWTAICF